MSGSENAQPAASLQPAGPWRVYRLILEDVRSQIFPHNSVLPTTSPLAERYGSDPKDVVGAKYLLAADGHIRLTNENRIRLSWTVGPTRSNDAEHEVARIIKAIRVDKARSEGDSRRLDVYVPAPTLPELVARYGATTEHPVKVAVKLEYPGLPHGSPDISVKQFSDFIAPHTPRGTQPALVEYLEALLRSRAPRERLPSPEAVAKELNLDPQLISRAYSALATRGVCIRVEGGGGTFVALGDPNPKAQAKEYNRHRLRRLLAEALAADEFQGGKLPSIPELSRRWRPIGMTFTPRQVSRTLGELLEEGSARREGGKGKATWFIDSIPELSPPNTVKREAADPFAVWEIADEMERRIREGEYRIGYRIPINDDLVEEFGVSAETVKRAIHVLAAEGLIATVMSRDSWNRLTASPGRYVAPPDMPGHSTHLVTASVVARMERDLEIGKFAGEKECDRDSIWPTSTWFAK